MRDMRVIVTGAAGFIGSHLSEELLRMGIDVVGVDNMRSYALVNHPRTKWENLEEIRWTSQVADGDFEYVGGNLLNKKLYDKLPENPDVVYHLAGVAGVRDSVGKMEDYMKNNVLATTKLLQNFSDVDKFVFSSSSSVYGRRTEKQLPVKETDSLRPNNPYSITQETCENVVRHYAREGLDTTILRYFSVYGPRQRPNQIMTKFICKALAGEPIPLYGDGSQTRDFTHVDDIVRGTIKASMKENHFNAHTYNLGTGRRISVSEVLQEIARHVPIQIDRQEENDYDVSHTHADISSAEQSLGYKPKVDFSDGVEQCYDWCVDKKEVLFHEDRWIYSD